MKKCKFCNKDFKKPFRHEIWCKRKLDFLTNYGLDETNLESAYLKCGSVLIFKEKYPGLNQSQYYVLFKDFNIKTGIKQASNNINVKNKRKQKNLEKYGVEHNFSKNHPSRLEWEERLFKEEGITNVFQRDSVKEKSIDTIIKKYGSKSNLHKYSIRGSSVSQLNKKLYRLLNKLNINYTVEFPLLNPKTKRILYFDIAIGNKIIEINGDYWHGNPQIYKKSDIILRGSSREFKVEDKWIRDKYKIDLAKSLGYQVLVIWEYDFKNNLEKIKKEIINYANS